MGASVLVDGQGGEVRGKDRELAMRIFATATRQRSGSRVSPGRGATRVGKTNDSQRAQIRRILHRPHLQAKLTVGASDDAYEREADRVVQQPGVPPLLQRTDWGPLGGTCANESSEGDEWALVGEGAWMSLAQDDRTGLLTDCDGMTCGGGFYKVGNLEGGICRTPRQDDATYQPRRWTPNNTNLPPKAVSPTARGSQQGDLPPGYVYDSR